MTMIAVKSTGPQWIDRANTGQTVTYSMPAGCVLRRHTGDDVWADEIRASPFTHTGAPATYRVDCDSYEAPPKTATLTIA